MSVTTDHSQEGETRFNIGLDDGRTLNVIATHEGFIMDVYGCATDEDIEDGTMPCYGTVGMTFDEWADWIVERIDPSLKIGERA
jgi:hypothetical protein